MDYKRIYGEICDRGQKRSKIKGQYYERHHILPKCQGGDNSIRNLTLLMMREHFLCHWLLTKIYPENRKLMRALVMLRTDSHGKRNLKDWQKRLCSKYNSLSNKGVPLSRTRRRKISNTMKGVSKSETARQNMRKPKSKSHRQNMRGPKPLVTCPHCNKIGGSNNMYRYHFDNCKFK